MAVYNRNRVKAIRQEYVATLTLRGLSQRKICEVLAQEFINRERNPYYCVNPKTGEPFNLSQINRDLKDLQQQWRERSMEAIDQHRARQFAELDELKRRAWAAGDMELVLKTINTEMKLLGTPAPEKQEHRWDEKQFESLAEQMSDGELARIILNG